MAVYLVMAVVALFVGGVLASLGQMAHPDMNVELAVPLLGVALFTALAFGQSVPGVAMHGIDVEIWINMIIDKLFPDNSILSKVYREDDRVLGGSVVHIPQAGANAGGEKNRTVYPAGAVTRTDTDITYPLDIYTTNPVHILDAEKMQISYDKMASVMIDQIEWLDGSITDDALYAWAGVGAGQIVRTSGADSADNLAPSATGTRKIMTVKDFKKAMVAMNKQNASKMGRIALLDSDMLGELMDDPMLQNRDVAKEADYKEGRVARLFGFDIMERSANTVYDNTATPVKKAVGAVGAATDNKSSLFFQRDSLTLALGEKKFYANEADALYFGDVYSALLKAGCRQRRSDGKGIVSLVQTVGA